MEQDKLNKEMIERGKASYMKEFSKRASSGKLSETREGTYLMSSLIDKVITAIDEFKSEQSVRRAGNMTMAYMTIKNISSKILAYITLRASLDTVSHSTSVVNTYSAIGKEVLDEQRFTAYKKEYPEDWKMALKYSKRAGTSHRRTFLTLCINKRQDIEKWDQPTVLNVGACLFDILNNTLKLFDIVELKRGNNKTIKKALIREELLTWVKQMCDYNAALNTEYMPLVEKPAPWSHESHGGYSEAIPHYSLVSHRQHRNSSKVLENISDDVLKSINILQNTGWKINKNVLNMLDYCLDNSILVGKKMGSSVLISEPTRPEDIETNIEARKDYRRERTEVIMQNLKNTSQRYTILRTLNLAKKFQDENAIYFPYYLDFRGRIYPKSLFLHPQGSDMVKALLEFSEGEEITDQSHADWLAIHGANCFGVDKEIYEDRISWVKKNEHHILEVALEGGDFWKEADDPWQFLAFCYEWTGFKQQGFGYVTHLPTSIDGSNNGLQILSLMMRDRDGATSTNVCKVDSPKDIYKDISDHVNEAIIRDFDKMNTSMKSVLNLLEVTRSAVKKQTMTLAYSATFFSCRDYTKLWITEELEDLGIKLTPIELKELTQYLATLVWQAINARLLKAKELMKWFKDSAGIMLKEGHTLDWETPLGFKVKQEYMNTKASRVELNIGRRIQILNYKDLNTTNVSKNLFSISPNIVHSLDAAALQLTILYAKECGVNNFLCVHDSFGTLCTKMDELAGCVRSAYNKIFSEDIPAKLKEYWEAKSGLSLPDLPEYGDMNTSEVLDADYFFC